METPEDRSARWGQAFWDAYRTCSPLVPLELDLTGEFSGLDKELRAAIENGAQAAGSEATHGFAKNEILANAGPEWDKPLVPETIAIEYVRHLEAELAMVEYDHARTSQAAFATGMQAARDLAAKQDTDVEIAVYRERARLVAFLAACYPSEIWTDTDAPGWPVVAVETPTGQMSWHIADRDMDLFAHVTLRSDEDRYDGHTTEQKYERLAELIPHELDRRDAPASADLGAEGLPAIWEALADSLDAKSREAESLNDKPHWARLRGRVAQARYCAGQLRGVLAAQEAQSAAELAAVQAELAKVQRGAETLGMVVTHQARDLYAMYIDVARGDMPAVRERVLNSVPDVDDNPPDEQWNGTETGSEWFWRTRDAQTQPLLGGSWTGTEGGSIADHPDDADGVDADADEFDEETSDAGLERATAEAYREQETEAGQ